MSTKRHIMPLYEAARFRILDCVIAIRH